MKDSGFSLVLPSSTVTWSGTPLAAVTGDMLLVHRHDVASDVIDEGQKLIAITEPSLKPYVWATHVAYVREGGSDPIISEMSFSGYRQRPLSEFATSTYALVHFDFSDEQRASTLINDNSLKGIDYGWTQYVPLIIDGITNAEFEGSWGSSLICSTHCTLVLMGGGVFPDRPPGLVVPARMASWVKAVKPVGLVLK